MKWIGVVFLAVLQVQGVAQVITPLHHNWTVRQEGTSEEIPAEVPGTVHTDLLAAGRIPDPYVGTNEMLLQWVGDTGWTYTHRFQLPPDVAAMANHELVFDGIDTYATVYLNGKNILEANNMFRSWRCRLNGLLQAGENVLEVQFHPIKRVNKFKARASLPLPAGSDTARYALAPYVRKAGFQFGWDFAPRFLTMGLWKDVRLESWHTLRLDEVGAYTVSVKDTMAEVLVKLAVESSIDQKVIVRIGESIRGWKLHPGVQAMGVDLHLKDPKLWWPNGTGAPHLYAFDVAVTNWEGDTLLLRRITTGLRTVELINEPDSLGTSFYFKVNGRPVFMQGANYVPQDVFLPRVTNAQYRHLIKLAQGAGMNMLRVWGGGVYEREIFYALCDSAGIMVWQDFMFAGGLYPAEPDFLANVSEEVKEQAKRLENHPCMALWCGNNEIEVAWKNWGWQQKYGYTTADSLHLWKNYEQLFHHTIPDALDELYSLLPYVPTSPQSNWGKAENFNHGSMHYWGVWHGKDRITDYPNRVGRFMVEWGFQSYPSAHLMKNYLHAGPVDLESAAVIHRQKSYVGNRRILEGLEEWRPGSSLVDFEAFCSSSQDVQAWAYALALRAHRSRAPFCMGSLLWQLNDCWPGPSWSIIQYDGTPKKAYHAVKEVLLEP